MGDIEGWWAPIKKIRAPRSSARTGRRQLTHTNSTVARNDAGSGAAGPVGTKVSRDVPRIEAGRIRGNNGSVYARVAVAWLLVYCFNPARSTLGTTQDFDFHGFAPTLDQISRTSGAVERGNLPTRPLFSRRKTCEKNGRYCFRLGMGANPR